MDSRRQVEILLREAQAELERAVARSTAQAEQASTTLNRFFDMAPLGLAMFDEQLRLVRINEALARAQGMDAAGRLKDQFLARVSHELRSPLQVALSSTEVLKRVGGLPEPAQRVVQRLAHSVRQQARMVSDLLDVSRILSGKLHLELRLEAGAVAQAVRQVLALPPPQGGPRPA